MEKMPNPWQGAEGRLDGVRIVISMIDPKIGYMSVQVVGGKHTPEQLESVATKISDKFGGVFEIPDHPGASHIRLARITAPLTSKELIKEIESL